MGHFYETFKLGFTIIPAVQEFEKKKQPQS